VNKKKKKREAEEKEREGEGGDKNRHPSAGSRGGRAPYAKR
jgi:hypothetical protein